MLRVSKWAIVLPERVTPNFFDYIVFPLRMFTVNVWMLIELAAVLLYLIARLPLLLQSPTNVLSTLAMQEVRSRNLKKTKKTP